MSLKSFETMNITQAGYEFLIPSVFSLVCMMLFNPGKGSNGDEVMAP